MTWRASGRGWLLSVLLLVGAGLFVVGVRAESGRHGEAGGEVSGGEVGHGEPGESPERTVEQGGNDERVLGLNVESPLLVTVAVVASGLLAALVWRRPSWQLLAVVALAAAAFALLDTAELVHQLDRHKAGLAVLAGLIGLLHAAAAEVAHRSGREIRGQGT